MRNKKEKREMRIGRLEKRRRDWKWEKRDEERGIRNKKWGKKSKGQRKTKIEGEGQWPTKIIKDNELENTANRKKKRKKCQNKMEIRGNRKNKCKTK